MTGRGFIHEACDQACRPSDRKMGVEADARGMLMPPGINAETVLAAAPVFVLSRAISMVVVMAWPGFAALRMRTVGCVAHGNVPSAATWPK